MKIVYILFLFLISCLSAKQTDNDYFEQLTQELTRVNAQAITIKAIQKRELIKFEEYGDEKYQLGSIYTSLFLYQEDPLKQLPIVYNLLQKNDDRIEFLSITCYHYLALQFEKNSPSLSYNFLNKAIKIAEHIKSVFLPHLYHSKGRLYYNEKNYDSAEKYFLKANYFFKQKKDNFYQASMYNNLAMVFEKRNNLSQAIIFTEIGIDKLLNISAPNPNESTFLIKMKCSLGFYYYKSGEFIKAEKILKRAANYYSSRQQYFSEFLRTNKVLLEVYYASGENRKVDKIISNLQLLPVENKKLSDQILLYEMIFDRRLKDVGNSDIKELSKKLKKLKQTYENEILEKNRKISDILNRTTIEIIKSKEQIQLQTEKNHKNWLIIIFCPAGILFSFIILYLRKKNSSEKEKSEREKIIAENKRIILEQDVILHKEKIKNLHQNLNLKIETERAFLDNLKQLRKSGNNDAGEIVKDLMFKVTNLLQIDDRNYDLISESNSDNTKFLNLLSQKFPDLTKKELQLCLYFRMKLSSKEISVLENTSSGTIRVYKTKIKTKMQLGREIELGEYLAGIEYDVGSKDV